MLTSLNRAQLRTRYRIIGNIVLDTALHIGGIGETTVTDSPVIRDGEGYPFIPGSSLKGAFRASVERIVPNIGLKTCNLSDGDSSCISKMNERTKDRQLSESEIMDLLEDVDGLCDTCRTFGTTYLASVAFFHDAPISKLWRDLAEVPTQIRDGVGIDRDSECAKESIKFDFEVVPPQADFEFMLSLENPSESDLGLIALGLQEFASGMIMLGGIRSRGLGRCHLENIKVERVDFSNMKDLKAYLLEGCWAGQPYEEFVKKYLNALLKRGLHV